MCRGPYGAGVNPIGRRRNSADFRRSGHGAVARPSTADRTGKRRAVPRDWSNPGCPKEGSQGAESTVVGSHGKEQRTDRPGRLHPAVHAADGALTQLGNRAPIPRDHIGHTASFASRTTKERPTAGRHVTGRLGNGEHPPPLPSYASAPSSQRKAHSPQPPLRHGSLQDTCPRKSRAPSGGERRGVPHSRPRQAGRTLASPETA